ncbi:MAG TPA: thiamine-phosphate kinase [Steroidobacter sp.]
MTLGEFDIIARYFAGHDRGRDVLLGVGDDAAVLDVRVGHKLVVAMDTIVEGVHFPAEAAAEDIGYRALAVNLSDLAAMGAEPAWMTLSLSLPQPEEAWLSGFAAGLFEAAERHEVSLVGGDIVRGPLVATVQVAGWVEADAWLTRSGAKPGDMLMVSGVPGEAAGGLAAIQKAISNPEATALRERFLRPQPRVSLGRRLRTIAHAAMDVSDGLIADLEKLCTASGCAARLDVGRLPQSAPMRKLFDERTCLECALTGGDDYELIFAVPPEQVAALTNDAEADVPLTVIGQFVEGQGVQCLRDGRPWRLERSGYDHFAAG